MRRMFSLVAASVLGWTMPAAANPLPAELETQMEKLSASLETDGAGWTEYAEVLHPEYARWAIGELYQGRAEFVESLKEWWDYGMRVSSRKVETVGADMTGGIAVIRMKISETFVGPDGDSGGFDGYVVNVWLYEKGEWKLLSADIAPAK